MDSGSRNIKVTMASGSRNRSSGSINMEPSAATKGFRRPCGASEPTPRNTKGTPAMMGTKKIHMWISIGMVRKNRPI
jgi:hypothetical protein